MTQSIFDSLAAYLVGYSPGDSPGVLEPVSIDEVEALYGADATVTAEFRADYALHYGVDDAGLLWCLVERVVFYNSYYWAAEAKMWIPYK